MKPSVGRIVHVKKNGSCCAAIVTHVYLDETIDATLFPPSHPIGIAQSIAEGVDQDTWHWPERVE